MKITIVGATGFIGSNLCHSLSKEFEIIAIARSTQPKNLPEGISYIQADTTKEGSWQDIINESDVVINLAGRSIFCLWTKRNKREIVESRILSTKNIVKALKERSLLLNASAIGYYGHRGEEILNEEAEKGRGFLAQLCCQWENEASKARNSVMMRFAVVLGRDGGALKRMKPIFKMGLGTILGSGRQWFSWIHIDDVIKAIKFIIETGRISKVVNFSSPHPIRYAEFAKTLGSVLNRPVIFRLPEWTLKLFMGEMGESLVYSQRVIPEKLLKSGFEFDFPHIRKALIHLLEAQPQA